MSLGTFSLITTYLTGALKAELCWTHTIDPKNTPNTVTSGHKQPSINVKPLKLTLMSNNVIQAHKRTNVLVLLKNQMLGAQACNRSIWEVVKGIRSSRPSWTTVSKQQNSGAWTGDIIYRPVAEHVPAAYTKPCSQTHYWKKENESLRGAW